MYKPLLILRFPGPLLLFLLGVFSSAWIAALALVFMALLYLDWRNTSLVIEADTLIYQAGILRVRTIKIPRVKINSIQTEVSILQRLLQAGDLVVYTGNDAPLMIRNIYKIQELGALLKAN